MSRDRQKVDCHFDDFNYRRKMLLADVSACRFLLPFYRSFLSNLDFYLPDNMETHIKNAIISYIRDDIEDKRNELSRKHEILCSLIM